MLNHCRLWWYCCIEFVVLTNVIRDTACHELDARRSYGLYYGVQRLCLSSAWLPHSLRLTVRFISYSDPHLTWHFAPPEKLGCLRRRLTVRRKREAKIRQGQWGDSVVGVPSAEAEWARQKEESCKHAWIQEPRWFFVGPVLISNFNLWCSFVTSFVQQIEHNLVDTIITWFSRLLGETTVPGSVPGITVL